MKTDLPPSASGPSRPAPLPSMRQTGRQTARMVLILNPAAGHYTPRRLTAFHRHLEAEGLDIQVMPTTHKGHAADIVRHVMKTEPPAAIIAGGGDGTIAEIAAAMTALPSGSGPVPRLGVWPVGSANVLARELGIPFDDARNAALLASGQHAPLWPGLLNVTEREEPVLFLQMAGAGPDGWVVQHLSTRLKKRTGRLAYLLTALRLPFSRTGRPFAITVDDKACQGRLAIISKGRLYGGPYRLFPANLHGKPGFAVLILHSLNPLALCRQGLARLTGRRSGCPALSLIHGRKISCTAPHPVPVQSDGDFRGMTPLHVTSAPAPLQVITPALPPSLPAGPHGTRS